MTLAEVVDFVRTWQELQSHVAMYTLTIWCAIQLARLMTSPYWGDW